MHWLDSYELFLLDLDGTLVDTEILHFLAYQEVLAKKGFSLNWTFDEYCVFANNDRVKLSEFIYQKFPKLYEMEPIWANIKKEKDFLQQELVKKKGCVLTKGADLFLDYLQKRKVRVCVVTNSSLEQTRLIRKHQPLLDQIPYWVVRHQYNEPKPSPECYLKAIELYGKAGQKIIGFEDGLKGLSALYQTNAKAVLICPKEHPQMRNPLPVGVLHYESFLDILQDNRPL